MILSSEKSSPIFSLPKSKRKPLYTITKTPGPIYDPKAQLNMKYATPPSWKIGQSLRPPLSSQEIYDVYKYEYDETNDLSKLQKKWNHIPGGAGTLEVRDRYNLDELTPGPGRYEPNYDFRSQSVHAPTFALGIKTNFNSSIDPNSGAGKNVAPWTYKLDNYNSLSQHRKFPQFSFQKALRKSPSEKVWTKKESYFIYSSLGEQIMTQKPTLPMHSMTKSSRDDRKKLGVFKSMMERNPSSVRIQMPKF